MPKGISIHIGLNSVDEDEYAESKRLLHAEADAEAMAAIAHAANFEAVHTFLTKHAKLASVTTAIENAADDLHPGDLLFISFAGHGAFVADRNLDENDGQDETWCLYNRELVDDHLYALWSRFRPGVRILVVSDSCHSGTTIQLIRDRRMMRRFQQLAATSTQDMSAVRALTAEHARAVYTAHRDEYDQIQAEYPEGRRIEISAHVLLLSACQDWELAYEGEKHGVFTTALLDVLGHGRAANYLELHEQIHHRLQNAIPRQHPGYLKVGAPSAAFELQKPFTV